MVTNVLKTGMSCTPRRRPASPTQSPFDSVIGPTRPVTTAERPIHFPQGSAPPEVRGKVPVEDLLEELPEAVRPWRPRREGQADIDEPSWLGERPRIVAVEAAVPHHHGFVGRQRRPGPPPHEGHDRGPPRTVRTEARGPPIGADDEIGLDLPALRSHAADPAAGIPEERPHLGAGLDRAPRSSAASANP